MEKALQWVGSLKEREFVGTESRLNTIIDLLRQIVFGTETDPEQRIAELRRQRQEIDDQIARIQDGELDLLDASAVRDRYQQFSATARELLADFREVEENFRKLDRQLREKITGWRGGKGELLDDVLGSRETIAGSDQGKSFQAFYDFLLSQARQEELSDLLDSVHELTGDHGKDPRLRHIHYDWLDAAERTQATVRQLSEQLRRFLDDQVWFENRRVIDILRGIESERCSSATSKDVPVSMEIDAAAPAIRLPMERPLYAPVRKARIDSENVRPADEETDPAALFEQVYVDPEPLRGCVRQALRRAAQVGLAELVADHPIRQGVAELVTYLSLKDGTFGLVFDERHARAGELAGAGRPGTEGDHAARHVRQELPVTEPDLSLAVTQLMKGVVYRDTHERAWRHLLQLQPQVRDYVAVLGLQVVIDEAEGYAFCRQRPPDEERDDDSEPAAPADPAPPAVLPREPAARAAPQEAGRIRRARRRHQADADPGPDRRDDAGVPAGIEQRGAAGRQDRRVHQQGGRPRLPPPGQERRAGLRGPADPQGLRRRPVARRLRHQARRIRRTAGRPRRRRE